MSLSLPVKYLPVKNILQVMMGLAIEVLSRGWVGLGLIIYFLDSGRRNGDGK